jgi:cytochrome c
MLFYTKKIAHGLLRVSIALVITSQAARGADSCDIELGKKQYNKCAACHSLEAGVQMMGPSLHGLVGRQIGSVEGFLYSATLEQDQGEWTTDSLSKFLENPMADKPGTTMPFGGLKKPAQRDAVICYIAAQSN